ncbi:G-protein coupled receptor 161-like [Parasteatoda tepidariorum]|uniref:G-protein coupled receptor 161-like n=1 Tax=Parasteatoda tepidariorum TaxID=114398 RepID=UPI001C71B496|nr:rhodopsin, GQ-coupled-like [Parasteatoda tepidariorum]
MTEDINNDTKSVQVTIVIFYNNTYKDGTQSDLQIAEIVFLVIVILVSFGTNIFLLVTITSSYTLRRVPFNVLLANLSVMFLIETLLNMSFALLYATTDTWKLGTVGCSISSFLVQFVTLEVTFLLCIMCAEGMVSVWQPFRFQSYLTMKKQIVAIVILWVAGILLCIPLFLKSSRMFPSRYSCASAGKDGFVHAIFLTIWCYCLMIVLGAGCLLNLGFRQYKEYKLQKNKHVINFSNIFIQGDLWTEWVNFKLVAWLALFYLLLELPYIVIHQISALKTYEDLSNTIIVTPKYETIFTWFRYIYSCFFVLLVFKMRKDIRHKLRALINCCNNNAVREQHSAIPVTRQESKKNKRKDFLPPLSLNTPVLYISPDGLCLRHLDHPKIKSKFPPSFTSYLCDVLLTEDFMDRSSIRRPSKESEMSLPYLGSFGTEVKPFKDMIALEQNEPPIKKCVRFADTLTIFRTSPKSITPTPSWIVNPHKIPRISKIPVRVKRLEQASPWKVIKTPEMLNQEEKLVYGAKPIRIVKSKKNFIAKNKRLVKKKSHPPWKIRKLHQ